MFDKNLFDWGWWKEDDNNFSFLRIKIKTLKIDK
jgi:hypothetical protein